MRDGYKWCRALEEDWRELHMAVSSMVSDAKAVVSTTVNVSEPITNTHHLPPTAYRPPPTRTPRAHSHHSTPWELQLQPHAVRWHRSRGSKVFLMISVEVRPMRNHAVVSQDMVILRVMTSAACPPGGTVHGCPIASSYPPSLSAPASTGNARRSVSFSSNYGQPSPLLICNASCLYI
jgi:hypothetical protein